MSLGPIEILILLFLFSPVFVGVVWLVTWIARRDNGEEPPRRPGGPERPY